MRPMRDQMQRMANPIRVNRAPVLTLWAAVVAERLGHSPATALSLASAVAGTAARAKARRLGLTEERAEAGPPGRPAPRRTVRLLGREVPVTETPEGPMAAEPDGRPARPAAVAAYLARAFGSHLPEVRAAMQELAVRLEPEELNRTGFRLYEAFRPEVPPDVTGWGAKGELHLDRVRGALG